MIPYSDFIPEIKLALGEIPDDVAESYVRQSAIDFCVRSQVLVRKVEIDMQAGVTTYPVKTLGCEQIVSIQRICAGAQCQSLQLLTHEPCDTGLQAHGGVWFVPPNELRVTTAPTTDRKGGIVVFVAVAPERDSCECDPILYERYHEAIINGALARLYLAKATPWHDKTLAEYHRQLAAQQITAAGIDRLTGGIRGPIPFKPRRII